MCMSESIGFKFARQTKRGNGSSNPNYCPVGSIDRARSVVKRKKKDKRIVTVIR